jgi:hypothetical protein
MLSKKKTNFHEGYKGLMRLNAVDKLLPVSVHSALFSGPIDSKPSANER